MHCGREETENLGYLSFSLLTRFFSNCKYPGRGDHHRQWQSGSLVRHEVSVQNCKLQLDEEPGQQRRLWDCAIVLTRVLESDLLKVIFRIVADSSLFLRRSPSLSLDLTQQQQRLMNKRVIELGCGIGLPGLAAAVLGASEVVLTDMVS